MLKNSGDNDTYHVKRAKPNSGKHSISKNAGTFNFERVKWLLRLKKAEIGVGIRFDLIFFFAGQNRSLSKVR